MDELQTETAPRAPTEEEKDADFFFFFHLSGIGSSRCSADGPVSGAAGRFRTETGHTGGVGGASSGWNPGRRAQRGFDWDARSP